MRRHLTVFLNPSVGQMLDLNSLTALLFEFFVISCTNWKSRIKTFRWTWYPPRDKAALPDSPQATHKWPTELDKEDGQRAVNTSGTAYKKADITKSQVWLHWQTLALFPRERNLSSYRFLQQHFPTVCMLTLPRCAEGRWSVLIHHPNPASLHFSSAGHLACLKCVTEQRKPWWALWETG